MEANEDDDTEGNNGLGWIGEFKAQAWRDSTREWVDGALRKGFDSNAIMKPLIDAAMSISAPGSTNGSKRTCPEDSPIGPSSQTRRAIFECTSDSE